MLGWTEICMRDSIIKGSDVREGFYTKGCGKSDFYKTFDVIGMKLNSDQSCNINRRSYPYTKIKHILLPLIAVFIRVVSDAFKTFTNS